MHENSALAAGRRVLSVLLVVVGFLAMWQIFALIAQPPEYLLPSPIAIGKELSIAPGWYFSHASRTIGATLLGFLTALLVGCVAAIGIVYSRILENTLYTLLVALNSIPKIALYPSRLPCSPSSSTRCWGCDPSIPMRSTCSARCAVPRSRR